MVNASQVKNGRDKQRVHLLSSIVRNQIQKYLLSVRYWEKWICYPMIKSKN